MSSDKVKTLIKRMGIVEKASFYSGLDKIKEQYEILSSVNDKLRSKVDEWNKDDEIQKLKRQIEDMRRKSVHIRSEKEMNDETEYLSQHRSKCSGDMQYLFKGNGIGTWYTLTCEKCGEVKEIDDMDNW